MNTIVDSNITPITVESQIVARIREFGQILGSRGTVAGGAIRDLYLGLVPKDYDLFIYNWSDWDRLQDNLPDEFKFVGGSPLNTPAQNRSAFVQNKSTYYGGRAIRVENYTFRGVDVQLICWECAKETPQSIIDSFDYTINMMAYSADRGFIIPPVAQDAMQSRKLIFNDNHVVRLLDFETTETGRRLTVEHLVARGKRLARKLGFELPRSTIQKIMEKYPFKHTELLEKDL